MQKLYNWSEQESYYRFWHNEKVREEALMGCMGDQCREPCAGLEEVVLIEDTSELNLENHRKRIKDTTYLMMNRWRAWRRY
jgi:hypothetical protein